MLVFITCPLVPYCFVCRNAKPRQVSALFSSCFNSCTMNYNRLHMIVFQSCQTAYAYGLHMLSGLKETQTNIELSLQQAQVSNTKILKTYSLLNKILFSLCLLPLVLPSPFSTADVFQFLDKVLCEILNVTSDHSCHCIKNRVYNN